MPENRCPGSQACGLRFSAEGGRERDAINPALMLKAKGQACAPCCKVNFCLFCSGEELMGQIRRTYGQIITLDVAQN